MEATLQTIQDIVTVEDFDVSDCFQYSNSMESVKSTVSETFMSKPSIAKRRANQQETEQFYFTVRGSVPIKTSFRLCSTHEPFGSQGPCQASSGQFLNIFTGIWACSETIHTLQGTDIYKLCVYQEYFLLEDVLNQPVDFVHNFPSHP